MLNSRNDLDIVSRIDQDSDEIYDKTKYDMT